MPSTSTTTGLTCPKCGGTISIPEGQVIVQCPFCDLRSVVHGERGLHRYQVACRVTQQQAISTMYQFLGGSLAIARDVKGKAQVTEAFVAYLPFWMAWGRVMGWIFGEKEVGSGDNHHYEPREVRVVNDMTWNGAACDVGEFGVNQVPVSDQQLEAFNPDILHRTGLVFEPVGSVTDAQNAANIDFQTSIRSQANLDRISQMFVRTVRSHMGVVYFPLWVIRYQYRGRIFQVVVDGSSGKVLFGKAPGNVLYRAAVLVGGMAAGAFIMIDLPALLLSGSSSNSDNSFGWVIFVLVIGGGIMYSAFRTFRYGEQYEYHSGPKRLTAPIGGNVGQQIGQVVRVLERFK
jgi:hypothetical protein